MDSIHLIYDFFVPPHKYENFFLFFLSKFRSFHVSDDFFLLWVSCTVLLWVFLRFSPISPGYYFFFLDFSYQSFVFLMIFFLLWVSCGSLLFLQVIISSFWVFLIKVSFFSCFYRLFASLLFTWLILCFHIYDFFVPQHKNEIFFGFSYQSFVFFHVSTVYLFLCCSHS